MSGIDAYAAGSATALGYSTYGLLVADAQQTQARLDTLTTQYSTGLVSTVFSGLGGAASGALDLSDSVTVQKSLIAGLNSADGTLTLTQSVLGQLGTIASSFYSQAQDFNTLNSTSIDVLAASARDALRQVAGLLDTQSAGNYLFAGSQTASAPIPNPDAILSSGFYTQINAAVQSLSTNGAAATIASTLATATSNAAGTSPFSTYLSQPAAALQSGLPSVQVAEGQFVTIGVAASANTAAISAGDSTTGSYARDLLRSLATLGSLTSSQVSDPQFSTLLGDTLSSLNSAVGAIADEQGILGNRQTQVESAVTNLTDANTALTGQISNIQDVDIAKISTELTQTQASLQASFKMIATVGAESLLQYLPA